jgi:LPXTG-site transpeptidase (sortase) family protein
MEMETPDTTLSTPADPATASPGTAKRRRRSWKRWLADGMIVAGVLVLLYPIGTWGYTWWEQRQLREELEESNPAMVATAATIAAGEFISVSERADNAEATSNSAAVTASELAAAEAARAALEEKRLAQVAAFRAAADAYQTQVGGKTGEPIGKILIPSIGVDVVMLEGTSTGDLREGPGHWEETPFPGQGGNFVVSGHRTTYGAPFRKLDDLQVGDIIDLVLPYAVARYMVTRVIIVDPDEVEEVAQRGREQVSLAACHPLYSARQRIVAQGDLVSFKLTEAAAH